MLGFVFSGGGARGAYQAGVFTKLDQVARFKSADLISGTSAGAINAALIASGKSAEEIVEFWLRLGDDPPVSVDTSLFRAGFTSALKTAIGGLRVPPRGTLGSLLSRATKHLPLEPPAAAAFGAEWLLTRRFDLVERFFDGLPASALADTRRLREVLRDTFGGDTVKTGRGLAISVVDVLRHNVVRFVNREPVTRSSAEYVVVPEITVDMVLASASIPLLFPPVPIEVGGEQRLFWDGGVLVNTPLAPAVALGADEIVPVLCTQKGNVEARAFERFGHAIEHLTDTLLDNSYNVDRSLLLERNRRAAQRPQVYRSVKLYRPVRPDGEVFNAGSYLYFQRPVLQTLFTLGRDAAEKWLTAGPEVDELEGERRPPGTPESSRRTA